jgi:hypothetical protein
MQSQAPSAPRRGPRVAAVIIIFLIVGGLSEVGIRLLLKEQPDTGMLLLKRVPLLPYRPGAAQLKAAATQISTSTYIQRDSDLGWSLRPNGTSGPYTSNSQGIRARPETVYTSSAAEGIFRISVFGDSFTHGDGLPIDQIWSDNLEKSREGLEVINFGVGGYGTGQALLRYRRDGTKFQTHAAILGIWPEDLCRNMNLLRFYMTPNGGISGPKPRFILKDGELKLINYPVVDTPTFSRILETGGPHPLLENEEWLSPSETAFPWYYHWTPLRTGLSVLNAYQRRTRRHDLYFGADPRANALATAISVAFAEEVRATGAQPFVALLPMRDFMAEHKNNGFPLVDLLKNAGIKVLDLGPVFADAVAAEGQTALFLSDGHLNAHGNAIAAQELARQLQAQAVGFPAD